MSRRPETLSDLLKIPPRRQGDSWMCERIASTFASEYREDLRHFTDYNYDYAETDAKDEFLARLGVDVIEEVSTHGDMLTIGILRFDGEPVAAFNWACPSEEKVDDSWSWMLISKAQANRLADAYLAIGKKYEPLMDEASPDDKATSVLMHDISLDYGADGLVYVGATKIFDAYAGKKDGTSLYERGNGGYVIMGLGGVLIEPAPDAKERAFASYKKAVDDLTEQLLARHESEPERQFLILSGDQTEIIGLDKGTAYIGKEPIPMEAVRDRVNEYTSEQLGKHLPDEKFKM